MVLNVFQMPVNKKKKCCGLKVFEKNDKIPIKNRKTYKPFAHKYWSKTIKVFLNFYK